MLRKCDDGIEVACSSETARVSHAPANRARGRHGWGGRVIAFRLSQARAGRQRQVSTAGPSRIREGRDGRTVAVLAIRAL